EISNEEGSGDVKDIILIGTPVTHEGEKQKAKKEHGFVLILGSVKPPPNMGFSLDGIIVVRFYLGFYGLDLQKCVDGSKIDRYKAMLKKKAATKGAEFLSFNPVEGCALLQKKFKKDLFTYCIENGILQDSSEPSNDNTNVVNALQEPFVVKQDPGSHNGYNYTPKVLIIPDPEPFNNQTVDELPQTLPSFDPTCYSEDGNSFTYDSKSNLVHDSSNIFNPPPQPPLYSCEFYENDARYGHYCTPQVPFIYPEPCYNQDFNLPQSFHDFQ
nr:hypothetical protein [Tanacetum cinerariifolium]